MNYDNIINCDASNVDTELSADVRQTMLPSGTSLTVCQHGSTHLVGSVVLSHLLTHQEHPLVPLQLLVHGLVEGITDRHLTTAAPESVLTTDHYWHQEDAAHPHVLLP